MSAFPIPALEVERLGWMLLHSLWQFALIALLAAVAARLLRRHSAAARYAVLMVAMAATVLAPAVTWSLVPGSRTDNPSRHDDGERDHGSSLAGNTADSPWLQDGHSMSATERAGIVPPMQAASSDVPSEMPMGTASAPPLDVPIEASWTERAAMFFQPWLAWIVAGWGVGVFLCSLRPLLGWYTLRRLRRVGVSPVSDEVLAVARRVSERIRLRRAVHVLHSTLARVPVVVAYFRPVVLLPVSLVTSIPASQLEAILAHELAHVRRHDFLVNLLQTLVETAFFYHPAVWWLSSRLRAEREHCCDDLVVSVLGNRVEYGRALLAIEEFRGRDATLALGAADGRLLARVRRIVGLPSNAAGNSPWPALSLVAAGIAAVCAISVFSWQSPAQSPDQASHQKPDHYAEPKETPSPSVAEKQIEGWGEPANGLRARVVPVLSSMSEDAIDPDQRVAKFASEEDVAFAVELENVSDMPIRLLDTRYGDGYGDSKGKANSNWYGQFLFSIELFDADGKRIEWPECQVVDLDSVLDGAMVATLDTGKTHRFLLRPARWLTAMTQPIGPGRYRAAVRYHGMPERVASRIREYRPDSPALEAAAGDVVSPTVAFEVAQPEAPADGDGHQRRIGLIWGAPSNGLRAAMSLAPSQASSAHGEKLDLRLHVQNVSEVPITLASLLWLSEIPASVTDDKGDSMVAGSTFYTGRTLATRVTLKPEQIVVFNAGNLGLAVTQQRAGTFDDVTNRTLVAPAGKYTIQLSSRFGNSFTLKDGKGKVLAPLEGDWIGELRTGVTPLEITHETIACNIVDAVTEEPVAGTTVNFRFLKPASGDSAEEIVDDVFWGPQAPSQITFTIPDRVMQRADREEIEVEWGVGQHPDYEDHSPARRIPLKQFFREGTQAVREALETIKLTRKQKAAATAPPKGRESLPAGMMQLFAATRSPELGTSQPVYAVRFADADSLVTSSSGDARVWDVRSGRLRHTLPHQDMTTTVRGLATSPDGATIVTSAFDDTLGVWERATGKRLFMLKGHGTKGGIRLVRFKPDGSQFASWGDDAVLRWWNTRDGTLAASHLIKLPGYVADERTRPRFGYKMTQTFTPDAKSLFVWYEGWWFEFETANGNLVRQVAADREFSSLAVSPDGRWLAAAEVRRDARQEIASMSVALIDRMTLKIVRQWPVSNPRGAERVEDLSFGPFNEHALAFSPDSKLLAWSRGGRHNGIDVVEIQHDRLHASIPVDSLCWCLDFSPDGAFIASGHSDSTIRVWNRWQSAFVLRPVARDGRWASANRTVRVRVVDAEDATPIEGVVVSAQRWEGPRQYEEDGVAATDAKGFVAFAGLDAIHYRWWLGAARPLPYIEKQRTSSPDAHEVVIQLKKACELTLRAVDAETGRGVAGVKFGRERALAELWLQDITPDTLRTQEASFGDSAESLLTGDDGRFRCLVNENTWSYSVVKYPHGYGSIVPIDGKQEVEIETPGGGMVEYTFKLRKKAGKQPQENSAAVDAETADDKAGSGLLPGYFGGFAQTMQIGADGTITYRDTRTLCQMKLFDDDRLMIGFHDDNRIWMDVTLPLVTGAGGQQRAVWSAEMDGYAYQATAIPFSTRGCLFRLEKRRDGKLIHGSLQYFAVKSRQANVKQDEPANPIDHRDWRVDQSGTGVVAGRYTGASQTMQIAADGTISYTDQPLGICHLAVLEDDRLTATFRDARGMPTEVTLPLATTAAEHRASWSAEIDGRTLRATAVPYSDTVYLFRLEWLRDGKRIEGSQQFYAIDQKLRPATAAERAEAARDPQWQVRLGDQIKLPDIIARLNKQEEALKGCIVIAETQMKQRTGIAFDGPELEREFKTAFRFDDRGRIYSRQEGGVPGRIGTGEVLQQIQVGAYDGKAVTILRGKDEFDWAYHGPDQTRIPREIDPRDYLYRYWGERLGELLSKKNYHIVGLERWRDQDVIVVESEPTVRPERKASYQGRLLIAPAFDYAVVVRTARIRFDDLGPEWHEFSRQETFDYELHKETGLWFPRHGTYTSLNPTREQAEKKEAAPLSWKKETTFTRWKLNPEFTDADFTLKIPAGIFVMKEPIPPQPKEEPQPKEPPRPKQDAGPE